MPRPKVPSIAARRQIVLERVIAAAPGEVWKLWTTKKGIESWWGPDGFSTRVRKLNVRPGGEFVYVMTASAPDTIQFLEQAGMPVSTESRATFVEVDPLLRLSYTQPVDFVPDVTPYDITIAAEFRPHPKGTKLVVTIDAMHAEEWTQRAVLGWKMQLRRLAERLAK